MWRCPVRTKKIKYFVKKKKWFSETNQKWLISKRDEYNKNYILPLIIAVISIAPNSPKITNNIPKGNNAACSTIVDNTIQIIPAITTKPDTELPAHLINIPKLMIITSM